GVVGGDRVRNRLHDHRLTGLGGRYDKATLALADRGVDVDNATDQVVGRGLQPQSLRGVERGELLELDPVLRFLGVSAVDSVETNERVELLLALALSGLAELTHD